MTNLRRQASRRASSLRTKASKGIGLFSSQGLPGERKSGTPLSVEMPAPVKPVITDARPTRVRKLAIWSWSSLFGPGMGANLGWAARLPKGARS